jgi:type I restriction enzyme M protein
MTDKGTEEAIGALPPEYELARQWSKITDLLFGSVEDVADYKRVVLGLIFLKHLSDVSENQEARVIDPTRQSADSECADQRGSLGVLRMPPDAQWQYLMAQARQPNIGQLVDDAIGAIERDNPMLWDVFPREQIRGALERSPPGKLLELIDGTKIGSREGRPESSFGQLFESILKRSARAEGHRGNQSYTPESVVSLLVAMLSPSRGIIYDPCCGLGSTLVHAATSRELYVAGDRSNGEAKADVAIYGQERSHANWQLAAMNLLAHGIGGKITHGDVFRKNEHFSLDADYILAIPPFNVSDWDRYCLEDDKRWKYGVPPAYNANFAWIQHILYHLAPGGVAAVVLTNSSLSTKQAGERKIRKALVEAGVVDCIVALPGPLFFSTPGSVCVWILTRGSREETLFIDAGDLGRMINRRYRELTKDGIGRIAQAYYSWRGQNRAKKYEDVSGFCKSATLEEIRSRDYDLTPDRYVSAEIDGREGEGVDATETNRLTELLEFVTRDGRVCPQPSKWNALWKRLPDRRRRDGSWEPAVPLILGGWWASNDDEKRHRLREHILWADEYGVLAEVDKFLRSLPERYWYHGDDGPRACK